VGRYPYIDQPGDQSRKGEYQKPHQTEIVPYERNTEVLSSAIVAKNKTLAVTRLTEPFRLEMKKTHMLRCRSIASLQRTVSTSPLVDFSRASHLDLFEQPANRVFPRTVRQFHGTCKCVVLVPPVAVAYDESHI
jgi:hypothetical protein